MITISFSTLHNFTVHNLAHKKARISARLLICIELYACLCNEFYEVIGNALPLNRQLWFDALIIGFLLFYPFIPDILIICTELPRSCRISLRRLFKVGKECKCSFKVDCVSSGLIAIIVMRDIMLEQQYASASADMQYLSQLLT